MEYTIQNDQLEVSVSTHGAELVSVKNKATGAQMLWNADPQVWNRHAPILFPYVGKLKEGKYQLDGKTYTGGGHGFARDMEFTASQVHESDITLHLQWSEETLEKFPRKFRLEIHYTLEGKAVRQTSTVTNLDNREMKFGLGYHPGFRIPFDSQHKTEDYELRFDTPQQPREVLFEGGLMTHSTRPYKEQGTAISLNDRIFDQDSICFTGLTASSVSLTEKDTGRAVTLDLTGYPYFIFWSAMDQKQLQFICLEPWHTHPDTVDADGQWEHKACVSVLAPNQQFISHLNMTFNR